ncbi:serine/threonine-protein phosphatase [Patescibacteria group bacterium]|nr:serine/threonine-protein phosphatase [Patescibacteria group bacterium]
MTSSNEITVTVCGATDAGCVRETNEDAFLIADVSTDTRLTGLVQKFVLSPQGCLLLAADGMGGEEGGEVASAFAIQMTADALQRYTAFAGADAACERLGWAVEEANLRLCDAAKADVQRRKMATTIVAALAIGSRLTIAHIGDSRIYLLRRGCLVRVTKDHTLVQALLDSKQLTPAQAATYHRRNVVLRVVGRIDMRPDVTQIDLRRGDKLLLATDGLTEMVPYPGIEAVLGRSCNGYYGGKSTADFLVDLANFEGGVDNITAVFAEFGGEGLEPPTDADMESLLALGRSVS